MNPARVVITASHDRSEPSEALAELLRRDGIQIEGILSVSVLNLWRFRTLVRQRGLSAVLRRAREAFTSRGAGSGAAKHDRPDPLREFLGRHGIKTRGLRRWCRLHRVPVWNVADLNSPAAIATVRAVAPDAVVYTGGGILRRQFIDAAGRVLNAHAGPLPEIRGMNAAEWAALLGERSEITIHHIDAGIDTGSVVRAYAYDCSACMSVSELRATAVVRGLEGLREVVGQLGCREAVQYAEDARPSRQCFIMAAAIRELLDRRLAARGAGSGA
ncbi:MAG: hypothetical protein FJ260_10815 [Planctomycetes bacterium]|nr:hypothetical protein [Verrucomicrobiota bacterium]MBM4100418.1 hypothetical protein [Planctomycetota bacterium]